MKRSFILLLLSIPFFLYAQTTTTILLPNIDDANKNTFIGDAAGESGLNTNSNTFIGSEAGRNLEFGIGNTFLGQSAGLNNTEGTGNTFIGLGAGAESPGSLFSDTYVGSSSGVEASGDCNSFFGTASGYQSKGDGNVFIGNAAGYSNNADYNTFVGYYSGFVGNQVAGGSTGNDNAFFGNSSGYNNSSGKQNTFIGSKSGLNNTEGHYNTFVGLNAGRSNTGADHNTFIGRVAGNFTTGGGLNTFVGSSCGYRNTNGFENTFLGVSAGFENRGGDYNTAIGRLAGRNNRWGNNNTYLGYRAGQSNTGHRNVFIGNDAGLGITGVNDQLIISNIETDTPLIAGDFSSGEVTINGFLDITGQFTAAKTLVIASDLSEQEDVLEIDNALQKINQINGVAYSGKAKNGKTAKTKQVGFVAKDLEKVLPELVTKGDNGNSYINYNGFVPIIIEAMKEQEKVIDSQEAQIADLENKMKSLEALITNFKTGSYNNNIDKVVEGIVLKQNIPNPASDITKIQYEIPSNYKAVLLNIYDTNGKTLLSKPANGKSSLEFDLSTLANGTYIYTLVSNGKVIAKQKMIVKK